MSPERLAAQLKFWFPVGVGICASEIRSDRSLFPAEELLVAGAVPKRKNEFATGRWCAREALAFLSIRPEPILMGPRRGPIWPERATGSITHTSELCAAIAGRKSAYRALGVDLVETAAAKPILEASRNVVFGPDEDPTPRGFSAKESVIKAISADLDRWLEFTEIAVRFDETRFQAEVEGLAPIHAPIRGWWAEIEGLVLTAVAIRSL